MKSIVICCHYNVAKSGQVGKGWNNLRVVEVYIETHVTSLINLNHIFNFFHGITMPKWSYIA